MLELECVQWVRAEAGWLVVVTNIVIQMIFFGRISYQFIRKLILQLLLRLRPLVNPRLQIARTPWLQFSDLLFLLRPFGRRRRRFVATDGWRICGAGGRNRRRRCSGCRSGGRSGIVTRRCGCGALNCGQIGIE